MAVSWIFPFLFTLFCYFHSLTSQPFDYPTANLSTTWINSYSAPHSVNFTDGSIVRAILIKGSFGPRYACGFYCNGNCETYIFAIFIVYTNSISSITAVNVGFPQVVWSANRNNPVRINATLQLTLGGNLVLRDADGTLVWSTNTTEKSVAGLKLTHLGNLVLFDVNNVTVWQSFDHPTDSLVPGQKLVSGKKLTASVSATNWTEGGLFSFSATNNGLIAFVESSPPQTYFESSIDGLTASKASNYVMYLNGSLALFTNSSDSKNPRILVSVAPVSSAQFLKLEFDGHLKVYEWQDQWKEVNDLFTGFYGECAYPMACGRYGICSKGQCSCPKSSSDSTNYFRQINDRQPNLGCSEITKMTCNDSKNHRYLELNDVNYFAFSADIIDTDMTTCKNACLRNCSCKAAIFGSNSSTGECYLPSEIFSLMNNEKDKTRYNSSAFVKVQNVKLQNETQPAVARRKRHLNGAIVGSVTGISILGIIIGCIIFILWKKRKEDEVEEHYLDNMPGMPVRFSYDNLKSATENFSKKLGEGGFGSVFGGTLKDGRKIAVKCLDGIGKAKKSFLAEVETIGSIHHLSLVQLIGFCAEKSHRLLVYEFMSNGSLDKWIYSGNQEIVLDWKCRKKIIHDVAKGLAYLHEECRQKILHLDIKPQNILLDEKYNAKLSDFGLSKLIDRTQSKVVTTMRGTPGYLAPEWLSAVITEKVDVYSYGVVVLEILCGRKNFEPSEPEEQRLLMSLLKRKAEEGRLMDLIDKRSEDMQLYKEEVVDTMQVAAWCLQRDYTKRPSMSTVVMVIEGAVDVEKSLDYNFLITQNVSDINIVDSAPLFPSIPSGPR
ncbi:G-type lectin S-receptor-like serine/threonine-protein kinase SD2-5 isoform X1 [Nicotiana tabacum]|uniref:G-type lectin S-receptor-like serine/threonine-protein kinase SD2-5 isoform X1 n=1 Tax=Nicotiana tabacum TaxID=4097 RepID=A0AC58TKL2_TOBAC